MNDNELPAKAKAWLASAEQSLPHADANQTAEIMDGLRSHITEALERGEAIDDVLARLGPPTEVSGSMFDESYIRQPEVAARAVPSASNTTQRPGLKGYLTVKRAAQIISFALAFIAAAYISFRPGYIESTIDPATGEIISTTSHIVLFSMDPKVAASLVAAILLTAAPPLVRGEKMQLVTICVAALTFVLAVASTWWIVGWFILPAAIMSIIAAALPSPPQDRHLFPLETVDA